MASRTPTAAMYTPLLGAKFSLQTESNQTIAATLIEVNEFPPAAHGDELPIRKDPFSMLFKITEPMPHSQGMYSLTHEETDTVDMFFVQVGPTEYEVIFN